MNRVQRVHCERLGRSNTDVNNTVWARYTTRCEGESGTVRVSPQMQCERGSRYSWCEGQSTSKQRMISLSKTTKHALYAVPPERKSLVYILVWTQSHIMFAGTTEYTYVYASHVYLENVNMHYICFYSCVSGEWTCVFIICVFREWMCVFISCVSEYTLESTIENIRDLYENKAPRYMGKTANVGGGYPL